MTAAPELDPETGELWIAEPTLSVLVNHTTERSMPLPEYTDAREQLALLRSAGVLDDNGKAHHALSDGLEAIADPGISTIELDYSGKAMLGWVGYGSAALLLPAGEDERRRLVSVPVSLLPEALSRLVNLGERPRPEPAAMVRYEEDVLGGVRRHWRLSAAWTLDDGTSGGRLLEVVDTDGGLWMLVPEGDGELVACPSTPTMVRRSIVRLIMRRDAQESPPTSV